MRIHVELDDALVARAMELSGLNTRRAVIEEALRLFIRLREQAMVRTLRGRLCWEGDLDASRGN